MAPEMSIGRRIQMYRVRRGLTQSALAPRIGRSSSWLSQVERGIRNVENWRVVLDLADALKCDPRDLVGQPLNLAPNGGISLPALDELRSLLTGYEGLLGAVDTDAEVNSRAVAVDVATVQDAVDAANRQYQLAHYQEAARSLARLVREAERVKWELPSSADYRPVYGVLAQAYQAIAKTLTKVDETELSWVAAERAGAAAERSEELGLIAATAYHLGHAFRRAGRVREAIGVSERAYDVLMRRYGVLARDESFFGLAGGLTLTSVIAAASDGDRAALHGLMGRADELSDELGRDGNRYWFAFGPTNVRIHRVAVAVELGDAREAIRLGEGIDVSELPAGLVGRRTAVLVDMARAYGQVRMDSAAVNMLAEAERLAPQTVRFKKFVRELTRGLLRREHRVSTPQLRPFAQRMGVLD
jgi:transcriptional regulator with XRE-family HTH domain